MSDILDYCDQETSYVGKVNQNDISVPISQAAIGNENYADIYNASKSYGYNISDTSFSNVLSPKVSKESQILKKDNYTKQELINICNQMADKFGVPVDLAHAVIRQESGWNPKAKSKVGAMGLMQLMPSTAKGLGITDAWDPIQNMEGGMKYLSAQFKKFGSWELALAAYNAGPGNVSKHKGIPPFKETQNYVKNIMAMYNSKSKVYPVDFDLSQTNNQKKYINQDTNMLSTANLDKFLNMVNNANGFKNNVSQILTNRPELLENKLEYADFEKYRKMKTVEGKPLFAKGDYDGFRVLIKNNASKGLNRNAFPAIAEDMAKTQTDVITTHDKDLAEALLETFANRFDINALSSNKMKDSTRFGLANLTSEEYEQYGIPISMQQNPIMQARVLQQEFQRAFEILGSENKAIYALAGGTLKDTEGKIRTWEEIKQDKENFMKRYFMQPSDNNKERVAINNQVQIFNTMYRKLKGIM